MEKESPPQFYNEFLNNSFDKEGYQSKNISKIVICIVSGRLFKIIGKEFNENIVPNIQISKEQKYMLCEDEENNTKRMLFNLSSLQKWDFTNPGGSIEINQENYSVEEGKVYEANKFITFQNKDPCYSGGQKEEEHHLEICSKGKVF